MGIEYCGPATCEHTLNLQRLMKGKQEPPLCVTI